MKKIYVLLALMPAILQFAQAQPKKVVADKIVAQIGDKIILLSDVTNAIIEAKLRKDPFIPTECEMIESELIKKALVLQAQKDSLPISDEIVNDELDKRIRNQLNIYGSQQMLEEVSGRTIYQLKEEFRSTIREFILADRMKTNIFANVKVSPVEVKSFFDKIPPDSLPYYESELELNEVVLYPKASKDVDEYVIGMLTDMKKQVESGAKTFESLAKLYSEDPGVKENGGQYSLSRNEKNLWDPIFLSTCFRLKEGQISNPIKTQFGFHIIQLVSRSGDDAIVRHILRIPPVTEDEIKGSKKKLDSVRAKIIAGSLSFAEAVSKYSEAENAKYNAGAIVATMGSTLVTIDQLDKDIVVMLEPLKVGEVSQPQTFSDHRGRKAIRIISLKSRSKPHRENLKEDYDKIATRALVAKQETAIYKWFKDHIPDYYIHIDSRFDNCKNIEDWRAAASK